MNPVTPAWINVAGIIGLIVLFATLAAAIAAATIIASSRKGDLKKSMSQTAVIILGFVVLGLALAGPILTNLIKNIVGFLFGTAGTP